MPKKKNFEHKDNMTSKVQLLLWTLNVITNASSGEDIDSQGKNTRIYDVQGENITIHRVQGENITIHNVQGEIENIDKHKKIIYDLSDGRDELDKSRYQRRTNRVIAKVIRMKLMMKNRKDD